MTRHEPSTHAEHLRVERLAQAILDSTQAGSPESVGELVTALLEQCRASNGDVAVDGPLTKSLAQSRTVERLEYDLEEARRSQSKLRAELSSAEAQQKMMKQKERVFDEALRRNMHDGVARPWQVQDSDKSIREEYCTELAAAHEMGASALRGEAALAQECQELRRAEEAAHRSLRRQSAESSVAALTRELSEVEEKLRQADQCKKAMAKEAARSEQAADSLRFELASAESRNSPDKASGASINGLQGSHERELATAQANVSQLAAELQQLRVASAAELDEVRSELDRERSEMKDMSEACEEFATYFMQARFQAENKEATVCQMRQELLGAREELAVSRRVGEERAAELIASSLPAIASSTIHVVPAAPVPERLASTTPAPAVPAAPTLPAQRIRGKPQIPLLALSPPMSPRTAAQEANAVGAVAPSTAAAVSGNCVSPGSLSSSTSASSLGASEEEQHRMDASLTLTAPAGSSLSNGAWAARPAGDLRHWSRAAQAPLASPVVAVAAGMPSALGQPWVSAVAVEASGPLPSPPSMCHSTSLKKLPTQPVATVAAVSAAAKDACGFREDCISKHPMRSSSMKSLSLGSLSPQMGVRATSPSPGLPTRTMSPGVRVKAPTTSLGQSPLQGQACRPPGYATPSAPGAPAVGARPIVPGSPAPPANRGAAQTPDRREPIKGATPTIRERTTDSRGAAPTPSLTASANRMRAVPMPVLRQREAPSSRAVGPLRR